MRGLPAVLAVLGLVLAGCLERPREIFLEGIVVDEGMHPVGGATVRAVPGDKVATTTREGVFRLEGLEPGTYMLHVEAANYTAEPQPVEVSEGKSSVFVQMRRDPAIGPRVPTVVEATLREFAIDPPDRVVDHASLPLEVHVRNDGVLAHRIEYYVLYKTSQGSEVELAHGKGDIPPEAVAVLPLPIGWAEAPMATLPGPQGPVKYDVRNLEVLLADPDYEAFGMRATIRFTP